ncbi:DUF3060 domain-containing protein [Microbacterium sp. TNHR37B]|uniref:DUF3060 domain-containing protein n=1 Tax=Microbacterium sp. TNHR37B TaxID=1775956 RepID=UPI0007B1E7D2|nr:DUF3060 domain-containing protein [Microbacterium sp. TNHR37B]KZE88654.1 hypothetical protein AVP41_03161 [Microbacterium sp. TNHR37B]
MRTPQPTAPASSPRRAGLARSIWTLAALGAVSLGLAGCTVSFEPAREKPSPAASAPTGTQTGADPADPDPSATDAGNGGTETDPAAAARATRDHWQSRVSGVVSCVDGRADVTADATVLQITDDCDTVTVEGAGVVVLARQVGTLTVGADASTVIVAGADAVEVTGVGNEVFWESGSPVVSDTGTMNVVLPAEER